MSYRIKTVSELTGIPKNTLVAWERRYGVLEPERLDNGYRVYSESDIERIDQLKKWLDGGLKISEAVRMLKSEGASPNQGPPAQQAAPRQGGYEEVREALTEALLNFRLDEAEDILQRLIGVSFENTIHHVYLPLLREVGERWQQGLIEITQEHFASAFIRDRLTATLRALGCGPIGGTKVACCTFPNERHEIGALALAVHLASRGCRVTYLGANVPAESLCSFVQQNRPTWLCTSVVMRTSARALEDYARMLVESCGDHTRIAIGGSGMPHDLPQVEGVSLLYGFGDLDAAMKLS